MATKGTTKIISTNRAVQTSCKNTKVRTASGSCAKERKPMMAVGGMTESCGPGKPKGCGYAKAQRKNNRSKLGSKILPVVGKVLTTAATIGGLAYGAMKGKKMLENKKVGGATHPGFKAVQSKIAAKQGVSKEAAGAILAASTRKASGKAKAANPRLKKVK